MAVMVVMFFTSFGKGDAPAERSFSELLTSIEAGDVKSLEVRETSDGHQFTGELKTGVKFVTIGFMSDGVHDSLRQAATDHQTK